MSKKNKHDDYIDRLKRFRWVQWQIVRRHEDYIKFCDKQTFNKLGVLPEGATPLNIEEAFELVDDPAEPSRKIINPTLAILETSEKARSIKKRFFLNKIYDYSEDLSEDECLDICGWLKHMVPIWPKLENFNADDLPQYGDFIYVGINIALDVNLKDIRDEVLNHVRLMRRSRKEIRKWHTEDIKERLSRLKSFTPGKAIKIDDEVKGILEQMGETISETQIKELRIKGEITTIDSIIKKFQEEMFDIKQGPTRTTLGKKQKLAFYEELFTIWDLHIEGKTDREIIQKIWPDKYKKEWKETDFDKDERYSELLEKYRLEGVEDYDGRAFNEAYGNKNENLKSESSRINLLAKIYDKRKRMRELFNMFPEV